MNYKAIIFDFYGVVSSEVGIVWLKSKFGDEKAKEIEKRYGPIADKEEITEEELFEAMGKLAQEDPKEVRKAWLKLAVINRGVIELIKKLKPSYKIILLSNATRPFFEQLMEENNLKKLFDDIVVSFEIKAIKPEPKIYRIALERSGLSPEETIFIDDREENIKASEALGIKSILFIDTESLEIELRELGI